ASRTSLARKEPRSLELYHGRRSPLLAEVRSRSLLSSAGQDDALFCKRDLVVGAQADGVKVQLIRRAHVHGRANRSVLDVALRERTVYRDHDRLIRSVLGEHQVLSVAHGVRSTNLCI